MISIKKFIFLCASLLVIGANAQQIDVVSSSQGEPYSITYKITDNKIVLKIDKEVEESHVSKLTRAAVESDPLLYFRNEEGSVYRVLSIRIDKSFEIIDFSEKNGKIELKRADTRVFYVITPDGYISQISEFWIGLQKRSAGK